MMWRQGPCCRPFLRPQAVAKVARRVESLSHCGRSSWLCYLADSQQGRQARSSMPTLAACATWQGGGARQVAARRRRRQLP